MNNKPTVLRDRLIEFTLDVLGFIKSIPKSVENDVFSKQIIRSASSIGANYSEAMFGHSRIEFIHSINISRKEASETIYWLEVIKKANPKLDKDADLLLEEATSLLKIFVSSVKTAKSGLSK